MQLHKSLETCLSLTSILNLPYTFKVLHYPLSVHFRHLLLLPLSPHTCLAYIRADIIMQAYYYKARSWESNLSMRCLDLAVTWTDKCDTPLTPSDASAGGHFCHHWVVCHLSVQVAVRSRCLMPRFNSRIVALSMSLWYWYYYSPPILYIYSPLQGCMRHSSEGVYEQDYQMLSSNHLLSSFIYIFKCAQCHIEISVKGTACGCAYRVNCIQLF